MSTSHLRAVRGYELQERIGTGGFGGVYRAHQAVIGRDVAIKVILPEYASHPDFIRRFEREAQLIARLEHPYIVPLYDYWRDPNGAYLVMRYLRGGSLRAMLQRGPCTVEAAARLLEQIAGALAVAHRQGVIHRDLKPENILLDEQGNAYLSDFGIAKDLLDVGQATQTAAIAGSPSYISPEQARGDVVTLESDLYCLGVVLYEMLTGEHPFPGMSPATQMLKHLTEPLPPLAGKRPDLPEALDQVITQATEKDPGARYQDALKLEAAFRRAAFGTTVKTGAPTLAPAAPVLINPYKGLRAFEEADAADFFGRQALLQRLLTRLGEDGPAHRFLAVVGPSGSGKSSVVKASLIPALRAGALPGSENWFVVEIFPGAHPLDELEIGLLRVAVDKNLGLMEQLQRDERGLIRAARLALPDEITTKEHPSELLLVVDQFEECFTRPADKTESKHFLRNLWAAVNDPRSRVRVIITLRADFYDRPLMHPEFSQLMRQRTEVVVPLTIEELAEAICKPAEQAGATLEAGLVESIVADVKEQPGALPMLQYALTELFERREDGLLTKRAYQAIGGVSGALARKAEETFERLSASEQAAVRQMFLRLISLGEGAEDTRRRALFSELTDIVIDQQAMRTAMDAFGRTRLLLFDRDPVTRQPSVEVAHEALLREWKRLREWLDESRTDVRIQRVLSAAAQEWAQAQHDPSFLLSGTRLAQFEGWADGSQVALTQEEGAFLEASVAERQVREAKEAARQQRELEAAQRLVESERQRAEVQTRSAARLRQRAVHLSIALLLAGVLAIVAIVFARQANENTRLATSRELAAAAATNLQVDPELSALLALQALEQAETLEARNALHEALQNLHILLNLPITSDYSPDGKRYSQVGPDYTVRVMDMNTRQLLFQIPGKTFDPTIYTFFSPDGTRLAIAHTSGDIEVLDAITGQLTLTISTGLDLVGYSVVGFSDDGQYLVFFGVIGLERKFGVWDLSSNQEMLAYTDPDGGGFTIINPLGSLAFSPDGTRIATSNVGGVPRVWDIASGQELFTLNGHKAVVVFIAYSPDGKRLATASDDSTVKVWNATTGDELFTLTSHTGRVQSAIFSPDGSLLATAADDGLVKIWDSFTGKEIYSITGHNGGVTSVVFSADGNLLASGGDDGQVKIWEVTSGLELMNLAGHQSSAYVYHFSHDGKQLVTSGADGTLKVWDLSPGQEAFTLVNTGYFVAYSPDGATLASGGEGQVALWDAATGEQKFSLPVEAIIMNVAFSPNSQNLAIAAQGGRAEIWQLATGQRTLTISVADSTQWVTTVSYSPDGSRLATACTDGLARVWDSATGDELLTLPSGAEEVWGIAFSPDGLLLAASGRNGMVKVWDLATRIELLNLPGDSDVFPIAFSPNGRVLAIGNDDGIVKMWEVATGQALPSFSGHTGVIMEIAFSPDGRWLASASWDGTIKIWEVATGKEFLTLTGNTARIDGLAFSPDGARLASAAWDGTVRVYILHTDELTALAHERITRSLTTEECQKYLHQDVCP